MERKRDVWVAGMKGASSRSGSRSEGAPLDTGVSTDDGQ